MRDDDGIDDLDDDLDDLDYQPSSAVPAFVLPFVTAGAALLVGSLLGGLVIWLLKPAETQIKEVPRELTQAELEEVCAPFIIEKDDEVQAVQAKMVTLAKDLKAKREEVEKLKAQMKGGGGGGSKLRAELEKAQRQLAEVTQELEEVTWDGEILAFSWTVRRNAVSGTATVSSDSLQGTLSTPRGEASFTGQRVGR